MNFRRNRVKAFRSVAAQQCWRLQHEGIENILFSKESWMNLLAARSAPALAVSAKLLAPKVCQVHHEGNASHFRGGCNDNSNCAYSGCERQTAGDG